MARASGLCGRCGGPKRGRSARRSDPIAECAKCGTAVCVRHARYDGTDGGRYLCTKCVRALGVTVVKVG